MASIKSTNQEDKKGYLEADLRSLGFDPKKENELNDKEELQTFADNVKD